MMQGLKKRKISKNRLIHLGQSLITYVLLSCLAYVILYPVFARLMYSFMTAADLNDDTVFLFTKHFTLDNYKQAIGFMNYGLNLLKSTFTVLIYSVLQLVAVTVIAYGLARFRFPGRGLLFVISIITLIIPPQILSMPLYFQFQNLNILGINTGLNLLNTPIPTALLCITGLGLKSGLLIFMMRQYFSGFPKELDEAAAIDGAGPFKTFFMVVLPSSGTMLITIFLFSLVWQWTDGFYVSVFEPTSEYLQVVVQQVYGMVKVATQGSGNVDVVGQSLINNAAFLLFIAPIIVVFLFGQKHLIEGVERSGIVG